MNEVLRVKSEVEKKANRKLSISELMAFISINALMAGQPAQCVEHSLSPIDSDSDIGIGHNKEDSVKGVDVQLSSNTSMLPAYREGGDSSTQSVIAQQHGTIVEHTTQEEAEEEHLVDAGTIFGEKGVSAMFDFSQK